MRKLETAHHEAAHAVVAEFLGVKVLRAELSDDGGGHCKLDGRSYPYPRDRFACAVIQLAGSIAEHELHDFDRRMFSKGDCWCAKYLTRSKRQWFAARDVAWSIVAGHLPEIQTVGKELMKRDLTGAEIRKIVKRAQRKSKSGTWIC